MVRSYYNEALKCLHASMVPNQQIHTNKAKTKCTHILSFLGIKEEAALITDNKVRHLCSFQMILPKSN